ncbi:MAG TPA: hypothetical protein VFS25_02365 [Chitinophaga sp.]|uniref:ATP-grasp domain-containing protein n=1 Tax=Chitinophaga sp. TaxID=1869181 RepID=UPI002DBB511D|nr:hypothetical protein [Chitinophaga sp.]HEU4551642.1 hypothetical protein [Chitinophaga sp.]
MKIAYVCYEAQEKYLIDTLEDEEGLLLKYLTGKGLPLERVVWTDAAVHWDSYDLLLIKSPWDYHEKIEQFYQWLQRMEAMGIPMLNPQEIIKWNSDKHYLKEMLNAGYSVIPSAIIENGAPARLTPFFQTFNTGQLIVKPCISGGARDTYTVTPGNVQEVEALLNNLLQKEAFIVQPFVQEIETTGEWSFIFFNGHFSHCVMKRPRSGDFRVQAMYGGTTHSVAPDPLFLQSATAFVQRFAKGCLYARVDGVAINGVFTLMELELIEPFLFLGEVPNGYEAYYRALMQYLAQHMPLFRLQTA